MHALVAAPLWDLEESMSPNGYHVASKALTDHRHIHADCRDTDGARLCPGDLEMHHRRGEESSL